jgi:hypothetical protein
MIVLIAAMEGTGAAFWLDYAGRISSFVVIFIIAVAGLFIICTFDPG